MLGQMECAQFKYGIDIDVGMARRCEGKFNLQFMHYLILFIHYETFIIILNVSWSTEKQLQMYSFLILQPSTKYFIYIDPVFILIILYNIKAGRAYTNPLA